MSRKIIVTLLITWIAPSARAQSMDPAVRELIERMQARIDGLEKRLAELEHEKGTPAPRPSPAEAVHMTHDQAAGAVAAGESAPSYPSLKINGFSDINFSSSNLHAPAAGFGGATLLSPRSGFSEGQFVLHFSSALSPKVSAFGELSFTARTDAGVSVNGSPAAPGFNPEVERIIIRYDLND